MLKVETKKHDVHPGEEQDVIIKVGNFRLYFQNYYTLISLVNDLLLGAMYLSGSLIQAFTTQDRLGMYLFIFAGFFLLMRPVIRIVHNVYLYKEHEYRRQVLGEDPESDAEKVEQESASHEINVQQSEDNDEHEESNANSR
jgi:hypothetical protein